MGVLSDDDVNGIFRVLQCNALQLSEVLSVEFQDGSAGFYPESQLIFIVT